MLSPSLLPATTASALLKHLYHRDHHLVYVYVNWERWQHINVRRWVAESVDCRTKWTREPSTDWILRRETECLDRSTVTDCRQTSTQTDRQTLRHTDRQTQRHTDRQTHTHTHTGTKLDNSDACKSAPEASRRLRSFGAITCVIPWSRTRLHDRSFVWN